MVNRPLSGGVMWRDAISHSRVCTYHPLIGSHNVSYANPPIKGVMVVPIILSYVYVHTKV